MKFWLPEENHRESCSAPGQQPAHLAGSASGAASTAAASHPGSSSKPANTAPILPPGSDVAAAPAVLAAAASSAAPAERPGVRSGRRYKYRRHCAEKVAWNVRGTRSAWHARSSPGCAVLMAVSMSCRGGRQVRCTTMRHGSVAETHRVQEAGSSGRSYQCNLPSNAGATLVAANSPPMLSSNMPRSQSVQPLACCLTPASQV